MKRVDEYTYMLSEISNLTDASVEWVYYCELLSNLDIDKCSYYEKKVVYK